MTRLRKSLEQRILDGRVMDEVGCWNWQGWSYSGYGRISIDTRLHMAHRVSYEHFVGPIGEGLVLDHLCRNKACINPAHLEPVTQRTNMQRGVVAQKTHCVHGHEFTDANTFVFTNSKGWRRRMCKTCKRRQDAAYRAKKRARLEDGLETK